MAIQNIVPRTKLFNSNFPPYRFGNRARVYVNFIATQGILEPPRVSIPKYVRQRLAPIRTIGIEAFHYGMIHFHVRSTLRHSSTYK